MRRSQELASSLTPLHTILVVSLYSLSKSNYLSLHQLLFDLFPFRFHTLNIALDFEKTVTGLFCRTVWRYVDCLRESIR
ncbi:hypothetical protein K437DRAFT_160041 [Tilletiaria anomala UBC 951]|uniref:Uncharacterized protein n=1 Tax=Tilletiaria anomala (strain ATCC 24038 / CBS 436.72 / UBC 951) TaxID=1037660 RepID=A0A066VUK3_TILAU|nr:uncharacterized protein K437DRAFT_160041 [Tilletiaria anomala UBC 951]KDN42489.1 hypothetical protein K437DRAFT_160041 [Tilletiaria anomala UBC 951]